MLADSRTAYNWTVTVAVAAGGETSIYMADCGHVSWAMVLRRKRMKWLNNGGAGSDIVAQMLVASNPEWLIGFGHINSVSANVSAPSIISDLTASTRPPLKASALWEPTGWTHPKSTAQRAVAYENR